jgi:hypothetical protein
MKKRIVIMIALSVLLVAMFAAPALAVIGEAQDQTVESPNAPLIISTPGVAGQPM